MKKPTRRETLLSLAAPLAAASAKAQSPRRLQRADSFLGIHFDFHAGPDCKDVGRNTTPQMIQSIIDQVRPDYLQTDCKGHPGYTSYPTKAGNPAPGIIGDPLRIWRDVTARNGVGLYVHYSGVIDSFANKKPGRAVIKADGAPHDQATSLFGPYVDELMIPQLREIAGYGVDGVWVDGDCWGVAIDYGPAALKAFREATGITDVPKKSSDPHWFEFLEFQRAAYRRYLNHYVAEVKRTNPSFQICSNWAFTDHMPEPVSAPVDFLSGDLDPQNSVNAARFAARFLARQGKPWDLMAWSFAMKPVRKPKTALQLKREAALIIAMGGGFQAYFTQNRDGSVRLEEMPIMAEVAKFCRARQGICHRAEPVPQIGLLFSTAAHYRKLNAPFPRTHAHVDGVLQALLEAQHSVELLTESQLTGRLSEYPLIVVPEWEYLEPKFKASLDAYVEAGGKLLLIGPGPAALFKVDAANTKRGRGQIGLIPANLGLDYRNKPDDNTRQRLHDLVTSLFPEPLVTVSGSNNVDVVAARKNGKLIIHLINTSGPHRAEPIIDSIQPTGPLTLTIRQSRKPSGVTLEPASQKLAHHFSKGMLTVSIPSVELLDSVIVN